MYEFVIALKAVGLLLGIALLCMAGAWLLILPLRIIEERRYQRDRAMVRKYLQDTSQYPRSNVRVIYPTKIGEYNV